MEQSELFDWILEVKTCEQCPPGPRAACRGSANAPVLIVGQAPGRQEAIEGKPFVGPAGKVLDQALISVGLSEENVLITNPVFFAPPADRTPTPDELAHGKTHLDALIEKLKPKLIIPLGAVATHLFVSSPWGMTKLSGILQGDNVFPILHPAAILHQPQYRAQWEQAWKNLSNILKRFMTREVQEEISITDEPWGPEQGFVHLHNHSEYSKLDGHQTVAEMLRECRRKGFKAIALTDHGTLAGWMAFYRKAKDAGIKPILGLEAYIAQTRSAKERMHLILLAENLEGYQGIIKLQTNASLNQQGTKPIIEWHELAELKGVFVLTACTGGVFGKPLLPKPFGKEDPATAKKNVQQLIDWFGKDHVFLEVQPHPTWANLPHESNPQVLLNSAAAKLATELGVGIVATNDNHYVEPDGWEIQDVLLAIRDRTVVDFPGREKYDIHDLYIKDSTSILQGLTSSGLTEEEARVAISNSTKIADSCAVEVPRGKNILPPVKFPPQHLTAEAYFAQLVEDGFARLLPDKLNHEVYLARLQYELDLYTKKSFVDYMLIVWELVQWCKANNIATGPGRGSVSGSLVAYVLGITGVDPIEHDIIMERFVSEVRTDMPDIDLDVQDDKREEVIEHLRQMYGLDNVMKLGTEVRIHGRLAIRDAGKVLGIGPEELGPVTAALIYRSGGDARTNYTVEDSFQQFDVCKVFDKRHPKVRRYAVQLEGRVQYFSTHASGILMTPWPIGDWIPLERRNGEITTAWTMDDTEYLGLLKLDILGITGLNMVTTARQLIEQRHGIKLDLAQIPRDDELVMEKFAKRETSGIFQFGSLGLRRLCEQLAKAKGGKLVFSDLAVLNTLHRPAMLNIGEHTHYVYRVAGKEAVSYEHPIQEKILKATFGIAMYQEQIMMICRELGGLSWEHVGLIRKIISKRQGVEIFTKAKNTFVEGAMRNGCSEEVAGRIFDSMSHAGCVAGDTKIRKVSAAVRGDMTMPIRELYERRQSWRVRKRPQLLSMYDDARLRPNEMVAAVYAGMQPTSTVHTQSGHTIRATVDHFFLTPDGMYPLSALAVGSYVCVTDFRKPRHGKKTGRGPGRWGQIGKPMQDPYSPTRRLQYWRERLLKEIGRCERCSSKRYLVIHHKNEDHEDNRRNNLLMLCRSCHQKQHRASLHRYTVGYDTYFTPIVSIVPNGPEPTYDIAMAKPPHDYVANGFVVHNSYAFNKAHAVGYSMLAYQQMWLKVHFPLEYHAALLICESTIESKSDYIRSAWQAGIKILKPDVNRSRESYTIDEDSIRCGLADINGVGNIAAKAIVSKQPFSSIADLMVRVDRRVVNSRVVERLIMAGAFKSLHPNTKALLSSWKELTGEAVKQGLEKSRQTTLMGDSAYVSGAMEKLGLLVFDEEYSPDEEQDLFLSVVGFPREAHPITDYAEQLKMIHPANGLTKLRQLDMDKGCDNVLVAGIVTKHNWKIEGLEGGAYREAGGDMEGHKYVHLNIEDETDFIMTHFDRFMYQRHKEQLEAPDSYPVICEGNIRAGMSKIYVGNFIALDKWAKKLERGEALTAFERRLLRHPMLDYVDTNSGVKRLWQLDMLWPLDRKVQVLGLPIWTKEKERIWQVCLQDLHDGLPVSKMVIAWPDVFGPFKEELKSQSPLLIDLVPLAEIGAWCISGRQNCKVTYAGVE